MTTKREFILSKLDNFKTYLLELKDIDDNSLDTSRMINDMENYCKNLDIFTECILTHILPFHNNLDLLLNNFTGQYGIALNSVRKEDQTKIKRYLDLFCKFVS